MPANKGLDFTQEAPDNGTTHGDQKHTITELCERDDKEGCRALQVYGTMRKNVMQAARDFVPPICALARSLRRK